MLKMLTFHIAALVDWRLKWRYTSAKYHVLLRIPWIMFARIIGYSWETLLFKCPKKTEKWRLAICQANLLDLLYQSSDQWICELTQVRLPNNAHTTVLLKHVLSHFYVYILQVTNIGSSFPNMLGNLSPIK